MAAFLLNLPATDPATAQEPAHRPTAAAEEVPLLLLHRPYVSTFVLALQVDGEFFLPLLEVLTRLEVAYRFDPAAGRVTVSHGDEAGGYVIDMRQMTLAKAGAAFPIATADVMPAELELYVRGSVLEDVFGWTVRTDAPTMSVEIRSRHELPVTAAARGRKQARATADRAPAADAPLAFPRQRRLVDGATLEYQLRASRSRADAGLRTGFELFGGDAEMRMHAAYDSIGSFDPREFRWRYVTDGSLLSQLTVGRIHTTGIRARVLDGIEITNRTLDLRRVAGTHIVEGEAAPGSEVEVVVNDRSIDVVAIDGSGRYRLEVPLPYGPAIIRLRVRGPAGDLLEEDTAVQVPFAFLPTGSVDYSVGIGRATSDEAGLAQGSISIGLSRWLTARAGAEYVVRDSAREVQPWLGAAARLGGPYHVSAEAAPALHYRAAFEARYGMRHGFMATLSEYDADRGGVRRDAGIRGYALFTPGDLPLNVRVQASLRERRAGGADHTSDVEVGTVLGRFRPALGWRSTGTHGRSGTVAATRNQVRFTGHAVTPAHRGLPALLRSWLVRGSVGYDTSRRSGPDYELGLTRFSRSGRAVEASYRHAAFAGATLELRFRADVQPMRTSVTARHGTGGWTTEFAGTGAVALDLAGLDLQFTSRPGSELAGAAIRAFVDGNGNGRRDPGEEPVASRLRLRLDRASHIQRLTDGTLYASALAPYRRYTAEFDPGSIEHPMLGSRFMTFAFIADPNRTKRIDVPFFVAGAIDGTILSRTSRGDGPVPGLRIHVRSSDGRHSVTVPVFADGTFHHSGLPPGRYVAVPDADQLDFLGVVAVPCRREFEVHATSDGHFLADLDFLLVAAPPGSVTDCAGEADEARGQARSPADSIPHGKR